MKNIIIMIMLIAAAAGIYLVLRNPAVTQQFQTPAAATPKIKTSVTRPTAGNNGRFTNLNQAKRQAAANNKLILAFFSGSDWCGNCVKLEREVFSTPEFKAFADQHFVLLLIDFPRNKPQDIKEKIENEALYKIYKVQGFPTVLIMDANGKALAVTEYVAGGVGVYIKHLKTILKKIE